jgi:hypothetical protein
MAIQILCLGCRVTIEAEESPNWQVVPCFRCGAPLRMPVAVQKSADGPPSKIDLSGTPTDLDSNRNPSTSHSTHDSSDNKSGSTPAVPNESSNPVAPVQPQWPEPPPVPLSPVPVPNGLEHSLATVSPSQVELVLSSDGSAYSGPVSTDEEENQSASGSFDEPVTRRSGKKGSSFDAGEETKFKIKLAIGYLLFVIIPIGGTIVVGVNYINRMGENKSQPDAVQGSQEDPADRKNKPDTKQVTVGLPAPPEGFTSPWEKVGPLEVRIAGVAIRHVPILNAERLPVDSPMPVLAIWLETRITAADKTMELWLWQSPSEESCRLTTDRNEKLPRAPLGTGATLRTGLPSRQLLGPGSPSRVELLVFTPPSGGVKKLTLTLDADHVGEVGNVNLTIPASAWKK